MRYAVAGLCVVLALAGCDEGPALSESRFNPIILPLQVDSVFIGDSWTQGYSATPEDHGYAYLTASAMGWSSHVYAAAGTGYTRGTDDGTIPAYAERIASLPETDAHIVILQGSNNDLTTVDWRGFPDIADRVIATTRTKYPAAAIVMFGPCDSSQPSKPELRNLDTELSLAAKHNDLHYISCYRERWITEGNRGEIIDPVTYHPSTEGHAYLAKRLTADLRAITSSE